MTSGDVSTLHARLEPRPVLVTFESLPNGATVTIDGLPSFVAGNAVPLHVGVPTQVTMDLEGYERLEARVNIQPGQTRWVGRLLPLPGDEAAAPDPVLSAAGDARDASSPSADSASPRENGPSIVADGPQGRIEPRGDSSRPDEPGTALRPQATIEDGGPVGTLSLNFPVAPMVGDLEVDGVPFGRYDPFGTDHAVELPAGQRTIVVTNSDAGVRFEQRVSVSEGQAATVSVAWEASGAN
jgi:hypothetical protein